MNIFVLTNFKNILLITLLISTVFACSHTAQVKEDKYIPIDVYKSESSNSKNIEENWQLIITALNRMGIKVNDKNKQQFYIKTAWVEFRFDETNKRAILDGDDTWLSDIAREKHRFEFVLMKDAEADRIFIQITDIQRQVEVDLAADSAVTYLQWQETPAVSGSAQAFFEIVEDSMLASSITTHKSLDDVVTDVVTSNILHVTMSKGQLWAAIQASLKSQEFHFVTDASAQILDVDWVTLEWDDEKRLLKQPVDKEPIWAFSIGGFGVQQHRFSLQVHPYKDGSSYVVATHRGWREQYDATPDASVTMLEWAEKNTQENIAEAFLNLLSVEISKNTVTEELTN